jgi:predicted CopG family antitoxin
MQYNAVKRARRRQGSIVREDLDELARSMHDLCMSTKTISLRLDAYERLRRARLRPDESFSEVVLRAQWPDRGLTARELRAVYETRGPLFDEDALDRIDEAKARDRPPEDKWTGG